MYAQSHAVHYNLHWTQEYDQEGLHKN